MKYRIAWVLDDGRTMATEYADKHDAGINHQDIQGWFPAATLEEIDDGTPPQQGPFEVKPPKTRYQQLVEE